MSRHVNCYVFGLEKCWIWIRTRYVLVKELLCFVKKVRQG